MKIQLCCWCFLLFLLSCGNAPQEIIKEDNPIFKTNDPSILYFKNTRSHQYNLITQKATRIDHYYLKQIDNELFIKPFIANNWLTNEAYLLVQDIEKIDLPISIKWSTEEEEGLINLNSKDRQAQYGFIINMYKRLEQDATLSIQKVDNTWQEIPIKSNAKEHFKRIITDYFRLTEKI